MDPRCKTCPNVCKRLDSDEKPVSHDFAKLTVRDVIELWPPILTEYERWQLDIQKQQASSNNDLKLLFKPKAENTQESWLTVNAQTRTTGGTSLTFNYKVPEPCCNFSPVVTELTELVRQSVDVLSYTDRLLIA